jgi:hypothetical protein
MDLIICSADGCGAGFAIAVIAVSVAAYNIFRMYFRYKQNKDLDE